MVLELESSRLDLLNFGHNSSLEFPGGAVESGEGLGAGFLRELAEETGAALARFMKTAVFVSAYFFQSSVDGAVLRGSV